ncbi:aldo/keto reductase [Novosphingobium sp.]|uniref:aldo/keto reductase n=1 Tax=Novosphingobium sp. TaxID=1874826 RepID=UPI0031E0F6B5
MHYRVLGQTGLRVSSLALGTANFGKRWGYGASEDEVTPIYRAYREAGGNIIDTANNYQAGESEEIVGRLIAGERDDVVLSTKFTLGSSPQVGLLGTGNSRRALVQSVEASLARLATDHIDLLWVHYPDEVTPVDEIMRGLEDVIRSGKVLYTGFSNFPAWRVAGAVTLAQERGWVAPSAVQFEYNLIERTADREILPMANAYGLTSFGWSPLGGGTLTGKYRRGEEGRLQALGIVVQKEDDDRAVATVDEVIAVAQDIGANPGQVALAWTLHRGILPLVGPRTVRHLADNLGALDVTLSPGQIERLDRASAIQLGFPHDMNASAWTQDNVAGGQSARILPPSIPPR